MNDEIDWNATVEIAGQTYKLSDYPREYVLDVEDRMGVEGIIDEIEEFGDAPDAVPINVWNFNWSSSYFFPGNGIADAAPGEGFTVEVGVSAEHRVYFNADRTCEFWASPGQPENPCERLDWCLANAVGPWLLHYDDYKEDYMLIVSFFNKDDQARWKLTWHNL